MKKLMLILASAMAISTAQAENVFFNGTVSDSCTVVVTESGTLNLSGTSVATSTEATVTVESNSAGSFTLDLDAPNGWNSFPAGYTGTATLNASMDLTGANTATDVTDTVVLANAGTNTVKVEVNGTTDETMISGNYGTVAVIACIAP